MNDTKEDLLKCVVLSPCIADNVSGEWAPGLEFAVHHWKRFITDLGPGHFTIDEPLLLLPLLVEFSGKQ